jgi:plastocyanin
MPMSGHGMTMSPSDMERWSREYWAAHAPVGVNAPAPAFVQAVSETVTVQNFVFDHDGDLGTPVDTVKIAVGDQVVWKWVNGTHTITSGTGSTDPQSGVLFNQPMDLTHTSFAFTFPNPGTFRYYCINHEIFGMKGIVVVQDLTGVGDTRVGTGIGFASHPWPNPAHGAISFRYDVRAAGHVHAEVLDAAGRRVATVVNEVQAAGTYTRSWDGRTRIGAASPGRYFVRLTLPGYTGTQAVTITR